MSRQKKPKLKLENDPRWQELVTRYHNNIYGFFLDVLKFNPTWQQADVIDQIQYTDCRVSISSGHGTGKTTLAAGFAFWKLICFYKSVFMFTATKIQQLRRTTWKEIRNFYDNIENNPHFNWLIDYIDIQAESIKIEGYDTGWQIFAQTAGKGNPEALAGMHAHWYTVWADEASGIPREHFDVIEGALTETHNAFILSSQPTRDSGFFYDTHDSMSVQSSPSHGGAD